MEHFFSPVRRLGDIDEAQLAVPIEAFLNNSWDWSDLYAFAIGDVWKLLWITEDKDMLIWVEDGNTHIWDYELEGGFAYQQASLTAPSGETHELVLAIKGQSSALSAEASRLFWHAVTTSNCVKLRLEHWGSWGSWFGLYSSPAFSQVFEASPSLELLEFQQFHFDEGYCRTLATLERTGLEVSFQECTFDAEGATETFIEWLRHSQVVTKLDRCTMDDNIISALSGNSSVKILSFNNKDSVGLIRSLARALLGNQGVESLDVSWLKDETGWILLRSLWAHPRIQSVRLTFCHKLSAASKTGIMNEVLRLAQCNTSVHAIDLPDYAKDEEFFQDSILPRLEMNRSCFEDQRQKLKRTDPSIRGQLLGRALHVVRYNPDLLFRFLSENVPAFVRSDQEEEDPIIS
jgi:hypothetical protein